MKQHYGEGLTKGAPRRRPASTSWYQELANVDSQLEPVQAAITEQEQRQQAVDLAPAVQLLQRQLTVVGRQIQHLRRGPKREELQQQRRELRAELEALRGQQRERRTAPRGPDPIRALRRRPRPACVGAARPRSDGPRPSALSPTAVSTPDRFAARRRAA